MEDTAACELLRFRGRPLSFYAVYDGHEGAAAAEFAAAELHGHLVAALLDAEGADRSDADVIEAAVSTAFAAANAAFLARAAAEGLADGSTAVVALGLGTQLLAANLGDSRALLCTDGGAEPLTRDHWPGRPDEWARINASGGSVSHVGGRARLQGELSVSRSLGDLPYTRKGLSAEPELSPWRSVSPEAQLLLLASDGLFEGLAAGDICEAAQALAAGKRLQHSPPPAAAIALPAASPAAGAAAPEPGASGAGAQLLPALSQPAEASTPEDEVLGWGRAAEARVAGWLVREAFNRRSMDNLAAVVVDLRPASAESPSGAPEGWAGRAELSGALVASPGEAHAYRLQGRIAALPGAAHAHTSPDSLALRHGDQLMRAGRGWQATCEAGLGAGDWPEQLAAGPAQAALLSRVAALPLLPAASQGAAAAGGGSARAGQQQQWSGAGAVKGDWRLRQQLGRGGCGDVWRAVRTASSAAASDGEARGQQVGGQQQPERGARFVLKRLRLADAPASAGSQLRAAAEARRQGHLREAYFGQLVSRLPACGPGSSCEAGRQHIVRFVEAFEAGGDYWLVFRDEGTSLHDLMYAAAPHQPQPQQPQPQQQQQGVLLQPSAWWAQLRTAPEGEEAVRGLLRQLLLALATLHEANVTHRDVKPENLLVSETAGGGLQLRLIDFGSAVDAFSAGQLYGAGGPGEAEQTREYSPPEALLGRRRRRRPSGCVASCSCACTRRGRAPARSPGGEGPRRRGRGRRAAPCRRHGAAARLSCCGRCATATPWAGACPRRSRCACCRRCCIGTRPRGRALPRRCATPSSRCRWAGSSARSAPPTPTRWAGAELRLSPPLDGRDPRSPRHPSTAARKHARARLSGEWASQRVSGHPDASTGRGERLAAGDLGAQRSADCCRTRIAAARGRWSPLVGNARRLFWSSGRRGAQMANGDAMHAHGRPAPREWDLGKPARDPQAASRCRAPPGFESVTPEPRQPHSRGVGPRQAPAPGATLKSGIRLSFPEEQPQLRGEAQEGGGRAVLRSGITVSGLPPAPPATPPALSPAPRTRGSERTPRQRGRAGRRREGPAADGSCSGSGPPSGRAGRRQEGSPPHSDVQQRMEQLSLERERADELSRQAALQAQALVEERAAMRAERDALERSRNELAARLQLLEGLMQGPEEPELLGEAGTLAFEATPPGSPARAGL